MPQLAGQCNETNSDKTFPARRNAIIIHFPLHQARAGAFVQHIFLIAPASWLVIIQSMVMDERADIGIVAEFFQRQRGNPYREMMIGGRIPP